MISQMYGPSGQEWWDLYIKEAGVLPEQAEKMKEMRERLWKIDGELRVVCSEKRGRGRSRRREDLMHGTDMSPRSVA